jgi:hypothetical protein
MTRAVEIKIQEVSPESTWGGEEAAVSANAIPTVNRPMNKKNRNKYFFITLLPKEKLFLMAG